MPKKLTAHDAALRALIPENERENFDSAVKALLARNALLGAIESTRQREKVTKQALADRAGLDRASVRRMLTAQTANPTSETALRLCAALNIKVDATLPSGDRIAIVA